jgi:hypothetical protein
MITLALGTWVLGCTLQAQQISASNREIWMGIRSDNKIGSGTKSDPYPGQQFQYIMTGFTYGGPTWLKSTNFTVHLLPGTYEIRKGRSDGANLPEGVRIRGAGMDKTTLKLVVAENSLNTFTLLRTPDFMESIEISDLTVDANWGAETVIARKTAGIDVRAQSGRIERVRSIGYGSLGLEGQNYTHETFPILWRVPATNRGNVLIRDNVIEGASRGGKAGYAACIAIFGQSDVPDSRTPQIIVERNLIQDVPRGSGINLASVGRVVVRNNRVLRSQTGVHADTGTVTQVEIIDNTFQDVGFGVSIGEHWGNRFEDFVIRNNRIDLNTSEMREASSRWRGSAFRIAGGVKNVRIENNTVNLAGMTRRARPGGDLFSVWIDAPNRSFPNESIQIGRNRFDNRLTEKR